MGLLEAATCDQLRPYIAGARAFSSQQIRTLAQSVGGGVCGPAPSSMVTSAALQLAASRYCFDQGRLSEGSRFADASRQNLLAAHELTALEAQQRASTTAGVQPGSLWARLGYGTAPAPGSRAPARSQVGAGTDTSVDETTSEGGSASFEGERGTSTHPPPPAASHED